MKNLLFLFIFSLFFTIFCSAEDFHPDYFIGYSYSKIKNPKKYEFYTIMCDFSKPIKKSRKFFYQIEPYVSYVISPSDNFEIGVSGFLLYKFNESDFQPYFKIGTGIIYLSTDFIEQSTHFNFASSIGLGFKFKLKKFSIYGEGRLRHVSNAGIKEPNEGINSKIFLSGIEYNF
ncbi:MAG: acyloxyacyl hydrolase [bacterium]|nr:acyloxyacyl hydrolase [bacterium]MDW8164220.1 acyloxyacyl hydrolase [Candidatus Omnitrophota bacterium]